MSKPINRKIFLKTMVEIVANVREKVMLLFPVEKLYIARINIIFQISILVHVS